MSIALVQDCFLDRSTHKRGKKLIHCVTALSQTQWTQIQFASRRLSKTITAQFSTSLHKLSFVMLCLSVCPYLRRYEHVCMWVCVTCGGQRLISCVFLKDYPLYILRWGLSLKPELNLARVTDQWAPEFCVPPPSQSWDYNLRWLCLVFFLYLLMLWTQILVLVWQAIYWPSPQALSFLLNSYS